MVAEACGCCQSPRLPSTVIAGLYGYCWSIFPTDDRYTGCDGRPSRLIEDLALLRGPLKGGSTPIHRTPVANLDDQHQQNLILHAEQHAQITNPHAVDLIL